MADGICLYFCLGMNCWLLCILIFYKPHEVLIFPSHYTEILQCSSMTCCVEMVIYWGRDLQVFFKHLSKCSWRLSYVFFIILHPVTFVSVYDATVLSYMVFVFGCHQEVFDGSAPFKVYFECHVSCIHCLNFHSGLLYMAPLYHFFWC